MSEKMVEITLSGECTIYEVAEWQNKIIDKWSDLSQSLNLNMADVSDVDASFVQLLLSCKKTAHANDAQCHLINPPSTLQERLKNMHLEEILSDDN